MDIKEEFKKLTAQEQVIVGKLQRLEKERLVLTQEVLRIDGAIGLLKRMMAEANSVKE